MGSTRLTHVEEERYTSDSLRSRRSITRSSGDLFARSEIFTRGELCPTDQCIRSDVCSDVVSREQLFTIEVRSLVHGRDFVSSRLDCFLVLPLDNRDEVELAGIADCSSRKSWTKSGCSASRSWVRRSSRTNSPRASTGMRNLSTRKTLTGWLSLIRSNTTHSGRPSASGRDTRSDDF